MGTLSDSHWISVENKIKERKKYFHANGRKSTSKQKEESRLEKFFLRFNLKDLIETIVNEKLFLIKQIPYLSRYNKLSLSIWKKH